MARHNWIIDHAPCGISLNVLSPGATSTPGFHGLARSQEMEKELLRQRTHGWPA
ncbi:hypothetical protein [Rhizobium ruizarguesonis]|uniref:hypothetical protein n=1 Tax=Rhizobium ruizarguesonis TaxID=2081791 RepID=UPI0019542D9A|nr:hypothetical protein [Rhizobium ruizarguesonis]